MIVTAASPDKPSAVNMVAEIARDPQTAGLPISGIGGIGNWRGAQDFITLGSGTVPVNTRCHGVRLQDRAGDDG